MLMLGDFMSIFARSTCAPSACLPSRISAKSLRFSSTERERYGDSMPCSVSVPRVARTSSAVCESTYASPCLMSSTAKSYIQ